MTSLIALWLSTARAELAEAERYPSLRECLEYRALTLCKCARELAEAIGAQRPPSFVELVAEIQRKDEAA